MARPTKYTKALEKQAREYLSDDPEKNYQSCGHAIPSVVGMCRVLGVAKSTVYHWAEDKEHPFLDILEQSNELQELVLFNGALRNELNANIAKLALGKHGFSDKQELTGQDGQHLIPDAISISFVKPK